MSKKTELLKLPSQEKNFFEKFVQTYSWEWILALVFIALIGVNIVNTPAEKLGDLPKGMLSYTRQYLEPAFLALSMGLVLMVGYIDISVASIVALSSVVMGASYNAGVPMGLAIVLCILTGAVCGAINGLLLVQFKELAPMIVTLSTQIIFRGLAEIILKEGSAGSFPEWFNFFGNSFVGPFPIIAIVFIVFAVLFTVLLQLTTFGRQLKAMGSNIVASKFSGVKTNRNLFLVYMLNGLMAGIVAIFLTSRMSSTRSNIALNYEMDAITMVVLGGISTSGGKGRMPGVMIAVLIIGALKRGLGLINVGEHDIKIILGILLIIAVALPEIVAIFKNIFKNDKKVGE